jgi:hypothetical protein
MFLGDFRAKTNHLPDNVRIMFPSFINTYTTVLDVIVCDTLMNVDCKDGRKYQDIGICMPEDEKFPSIIIDTIH